MTKNVRFNSSQNTHTFKPAILFFKVFSFFYILSYQLDSLACTKNLL